MSDEQPRAEVSDEKAGPGYAPPKMSVDQQSRPFHFWPGDGEHLWGKWYTKTAQQGVNPPTQYRTCVHPECTAVQERTAPKA